MKNFYNPPDPTYPKSIGAIIRGIFLGFAIFLAFLWFLSTLTGCAITHVAQSFDPKTQVITMKQDTYSLWCNPNASGVDIGGTALGEYHVKIQSLSADEVSGLQSFNATVPSTVAAAVEAAIKGVKP